MGAGFGTFGFLVVAQAAWTVWWQDSNSSLGALRTFAGSNLHLAVGAMKNPLAEIRSLADYLGVPVDLDSSAEGVLGPSSEQNWAWFL